MDNLPTLYMHADHLSRKWPDTGHRDVPAWLVACEDSGCVAYVPETRLAAAEAARDAAVQRAVKAEAGLVRVANRLGCPEDDAGAVARQATALRERAERAEADLVRLTKERDAALSRAGNLEAALLDVEKHCREIADATEHSNARRTLRIAANVARKGLSGGTAALDQYVADAVRKARLTPFVGFVSDEHGGHLAGYNGEKWYPESHTEKMVAKARTEGAAAGAMHQQAASLATKEGV